MSSQWNSLVGMIHITSKLKVPADTGCRFYHNCLTCVLPKCFLDMGILEYRRFNRRWKKEHIYLQ